jgi:hypothetical protein
MENETSILSSLCFPCASALLTEAVINKKLITPEISPKHDDVEEESCLDQQEETEVIQAGTIMSVDTDSDGPRYKANLSFEVSGDGFRLRLQCTDGISYAASEFFTWNRIAQILIAAKPDMFGDLDEPWHQCFPETLTQLGYNVPDWPQNDDTD